MRLASWSSDAKLSYRRRKRFRLNLGDILGRRHAGFEPVSTEDTDELDPLYVGNGETPPLSPNTA